MDADNETLASNPSCAVQRICNAVALLGRRSFVRTIPHRWMLRLGMQVAQRVRKKHESIQKVGVSLARHCHHGPRDCVIAPSLCPEDHHDVDSSYSSYADVESRIFGGDHCDFRALRGRSWAVWLELSHPGQQWKRPFFSGTSRRWHRAHRCPWCLVVSEEKFRSSGPNQIKQWPS